MTTRRQLRLAIAIVLLAAVYAVTTWEDQSPAGDATHRGADSGASEIAQLFHERQSGVVVEGSGAVEKLLADDLRGSKHQRFILRLAEQQTILVSHNIDLAPRIDSLRVGDRVRFRGQYEWNQRGGLVHWTHHDPAGRRAGGWLRHEGRLYR
jgi:hypothetical protein